MLLSHLTSHGLSFRIVYGLYGVGLGLCRRYYKASICRKGPSDLVLVVELSSDPSRALEMY